MSGYVPKRVRQARTAMGTVGDRKGMHEGQTMLTLASSVGRSRALWRSIKKRNFSSFLQINCKEGVMRNKANTDPEVITKSTCETITETL
tara:strand:- start:483 stop:752 length:270 start_codon:yes stop_codon:yes gene_type:complete